MCLHVVCKSTGNVSHVIRKFATLLAPSNKHQAPHCILFIRMSFANPPRKLRIAFAISPKTPLLLNSLLFNYLSKEHTNANDPLLLNSPFARPAFAKPPFDYLPIKGRRRGRGREATRRARRRGIN